MRGTVLWWKVEKGYGRIIDEDDGEIYFVLFTDLVDGLKDLEAGQRVTFGFSGRLHDHGRRHADSVRLQR